MLLACPALTASKLTACHRQQVTPPPQVAPPAQPTMQWSTAGPGEDPAPSRQASVSLSGITPCPAAHPPTELTQPQKCATPRLFKAQPVPSPPQQRCAAIMPATVMISSMMCNACSTAAVPHSCDSDSRHQCHVRLRRLHRMSE